MANKKNNKSMEELKEMVARLESVVAEFKAIGCHGMISINDNEPIEVLMQNENLPKGEFTYKKLNIKSALNEIEKGTTIGNVYFHTYISKKEAEKELFA